MKNKKVLLTGYSGFVGKKILKYLSSKNECVVLGRKIQKDIEHFPANFSSNELYLDALNSVDIVIHCAARVHIMNDSATNPLDEFREVNTYGTLNLAKQAADADVKRFIFISSIKVNGESTELGKPFKPDDNYIPTDPYGLSKHEAEIGLRKIAQETGMEVVIIRPPLVYGEGVKANFASLMKWIDKGIPLPLGGINQNKRSLVSVYNLVDLIVNCISHPNAANQTFLVSDDEDVSTTQLLVNMAAALNVPKRLIPIPSSWFTFASKLIGKPAISQRLCGSLQVDISKTKQLLGWKPPISVKEGFARTAEHYLNNK